MTPSEMNAAAAQQQQNISNRAMIEEGIKIGRHEALLELRAGLLESRAGLGGRSDVETYVLTKIKAMLERDAWAMTGTPETDLDRAKRDAHQFLRDAKWLCGLPISLFSDIFTDMYNASLLIRDRCGDLTGTQNGD